MSSSVGRLDQSFNPASSLRADSAAQPRVLALFGLPWYIWCAALAVTSAMVGGHWDISWHSSIGRDTFWTPAHLAIYMCGVLSGIAFGYLILHTTFSKTSPLADVSVHIWGFRAPLGAFVASWGGITMLTSAPFDNWWHDAYGLDVKIVSPPHIVLFLGLFGVIFGTLLLVAGHMNRVPLADRAAARYMFIYCSGVLLVLFQVVLSEFTSRILLHLSLPYVLEGLLVPAVLAMASRASGMKFAATLTAELYVFFIIGLILVLPLFPAVPKLGPVYQNVTHFVPPQFPVLLIVPALLLDLLWQRTKNWNSWLVSALSAMIFVAVLVAVEWPLADFLMSPASRNAFFGTGYISYGMPPTSALARNVFYGEQPAAQFALGIALAIAFAFISTRVGISRGNWMRSIER
ncbi:MAG: hypothetical protein WA324_28955 [Bryobacteraceae bacterium]